MFYAIDWTIPEYPQFLTEEGDDTVAGFRDADEARDAIKSAGNISDFQIIEHKVD